jgi:hypothetical protein
VHGAAGCKARQQDNGSGQWCGLHYMMSEGAAMEFGSQPGRNHSVLCAEWSVGAAATLLAAAGTVWCQSEQASVKYSVVLLSSAAPMKCRLRVAVGGDPPEGRLSGQIGTVSQSSPVATVRLQHRSQPGQVKACTALRPAPYVTMHTVLR